jgi:hypothetical protein
MISEAGLGAARAHLDVGRELAHDEALASGNHATDVPRQHHAQWAQANCYVALETDVSRPAGSGRQSSAC